MVTASVIYGNNLYRAWLQVALAEQQRRAGAFEEEARRLRTAQEEQLEEAAEPRGQRCLGSKQPVRPRAVPKAHPLTPCTP